MTFTQLRTFLAVVHLGSVRAAAEHLVVSQPAVSGAVASLERELGVDLVARDGRGLRVTAAGESFAAAAKAGLDVLDHGVRVAKSVEDPRRGTVRIAAIATAAERVLLPLLAEFRRQQPGAGVTITVGNRTSVWDALRDLAVDLVLAGRPPSSLSVEVLGRVRNTLVVVGEPHRPAPRSRRDAVARLAEATWLLREEGSGTREATDDLLAQLGIDPPRMILGSNGAVEEAVVAGFGVALTSIDAVAARLASGALARVECPHTPIDRPWHLVVAADVALSPTAAMAARSILEAPGGFTATAHGRRLLAATVPAGRPDGASPQGHSR